jgi:hypothetical protein
MSVSRSVACTVAVQHGAVDTKRCNVNPYTHNKRRLDSLSPVFLSTEYAVALRAVASSWTRSFHGEDYSENTVRIIMHCLWLLCKILKLILPARLIAVYQVKDCATQPLSNHEQCVSNFVWNEKFWE